MISPNSFFFYILYCFCWTGGAAERAGIFKDDIIIKVLF